MTYRPLALLPLAGLLLGASSAGGADLRVVSAATSYTALAPGSPFLLTFVLQSGGADAGPLSVGVYAAPGAASPTVPGTAELLGTYPIRGLRRDQLTTFNVPVRAPSCEQCGPTGIYVVVDPGNVTPEPVETNNVRSLTLDVARDHLPDLRVDAVSVTPDRGSVTGSVRVTATVTNASTFAVQTPFRVSVYCSPDAELTRSDHRLQSLRVPSLAPGQSFAVDRTLALEAGCGVKALSTWVGVLADDADDVAESNEQNDGRSAPYWTVKTPDLAPGKIAVSGSMGPKGTRVLVSYRLSNLGGAAAGPFDAGVFLARGPKQLATGSRLDVTTIPSLAANTESGLFEHSVTIPDVPRGRWYLGVLADVANANGEVRKRNNLEAVPFDVTDSNLTDAYFSARPRDAAPGATVDVTLGVRSTGKDPVPATGAGLYYSDDPRLDVERDPRLGEIAVKKLGPGATSPELHATVTLPTAAAEGYRFLIAVLDETEAVLETDERDNVVVTPIHVAKP